MNNRPPKDLDYQRGVVTSLEHPELLQSEPKMRHVSSIRGFGVAQNDRDSHPTEEVELHAASIVDSRAVTP